MMPESRKDKINRIKKSKSPELSARQATDPSDKAVNSDAPVPVSSQVTENVSVLGKQEGIVDAKEPDDRSGEIQSPMDERQHNRDTLWRNLQIPEGRDNHKEYFAKGIQKPNGIKLIGARVRGKNHKHTGTNCDDWFEFNIVQDWEIMAVADGVGARLLSRVGAQEACSAAVNKLIQGLGKISLKTKTDLNQFKDRGDNLQFPDPDMNAVEQALFIAVDAACESLEIASSDRKDTKEYIDLLGRSPVSDDFATTLLLAVHSQFTLQDKIYDFVMSIQVGDGMIAAILADDKVKLMGRADSGEFAGQVMPINNRKVHEAKEKRARIFTYIGHLKAIMLMTDGVADDYFPNQSELLNLYHKLISEKVITPGVPADEASEALRKWLDEYEEKGSFDDRTLVILYREAVI